MYEFYDDSSFTPKTHVGEVTSVNPKQYTCSVTYGRGRTYKEASWLSPYVFLNGNGMYIMPQVGSQVLLLEYALGAVVIIGYLSLRGSNTKSRKNSRRALSLGDICLQASDQCYFLIKRGSEHITMQTTPACAIQMNSGNNTIRVNTQRCILSADGGVMTWDSDPNTLDTAMHWVFRDKAKEDANVAELTIGFHKNEDEDAKAAGIDKSIISLIVKETTSTNDTVSSEVKFKLIIGSNGRIICSAESLKEIYNDFIDRYAGSTMKDVAKGLIERISEESNIEDTSGGDIHHNKRS